MTWNDWMLVSLLILFAIIAFIGIKFPDPRRNWPYNKKTTLKFFGFLLVLTILLILMNVVKNMVNWPSRATVLFYVILLCFFTLLIMGIFLPRGIRLDRG